MHAGFLSGARSRRPRSKPLLGALAAIATAAALLPAGAQADVVTPEVVKPEVVTPHAVTPPPAADPAPAPAPSPAATPKPSSAPSASPQPSSAPAPESIPAPSPRSKPSGDAPNRDRFPAPRNGRPKFPHAPTDADYDKRGWPTCMANVMDVGRRCACDPVWCQYYSEVTTYERYKEESTEFEDFLDSVEALVVPEVEEFIEKLFGVGGSSESDEDYCQCSIGGDPTVDSQGGVSVAGGPESASVSGASSEVGSWVGEGALSGARWLQELLLKAN